MQRNKQMWGGVYCALMCPMTSDQDVDRQSFERYTKWVAGTQGVKGLVVNGNAGEVSLLSREERREVIEIVRDAAPADSRVVTGIMADSTRQAIDHLRDAKEAGADAALVFPIRDWMTSREPGSEELFFTAISDAVELPLIVFQYPHNRGNASFEVETLLKLAEIPNVVAVKEAVWEVARYQHEYFALRDRVPDVAVLSANDEHLFATLAIGADGVLVGYGGLVPDQISELFHAFQRGDLKQAREVDAKLWPLTHTIYRTFPFALRHTRIKAALHMMGIIDTPTVRSPLVQLSDHEQNHLRRILDQTGLLTAARVPA